MSLEQEAHFSVLGRVRVSLVRGSDTFCRAAWRLLRGWEVRNEGEGGEEDGDGELLVDALSSGTEELLDVEVWRRRKGRVKGMDGRR